LFDKIKFDLQATVTVTVGGPQPNTGGIIDEKHARGILIQDY
jgi:hypothetical protein